MQSNRFSIVINKPVTDVFAFTVTPPNSTRWIPGVIGEEASPWPLQIGTVYKLQDRSGGYSEVTVSGLQEMEYIEWTSGNYHCRYTYKVIDPRTTEMDYYEWVDQGEIIEPFTQATLLKLKQIVESIR